jgi:hypothetical protein
MFVTATTAAKSVIESVPLKHFIAYVVGGGNVNFCFSFILYVKNAVNWD